MRISEKAKKTVSRKTFMAVVVSMMVCLLFVTPVFAASSFYSKTTTKLNAINGGKSTTSSWYFTYFRKFNNCYIWLSNSSQTLENTKFVASELSLTLSLVLHFPIAFHEP